MLSFEDAIRIARRRGELMAEAAKTPGAMTAVSASADVLREKLAGWDTDVVIANENSPQQTVLSGPTASIDAIEAKLKADKLRFRRLPVATAFHSKVVSDSTVPFAEHLSKVEMNAPRLPVYGNTEAAPYPADADAARRLLANQLAAPVRFAPSIEAMYEAGARTFIEVGPGSVLTGLVGRILDGRPHRAIALDKKGKDGVTSLNNALAQMVATGLPLNLAALWERFEPVEDPRTAKKPKLTISIGGANYGKPYPPEEGASALPKPNPERPKQAAIVMTKPDTPTTPAARSEYVQPPSVPQRPMGPEPQPNALAPDVAAYYAVQSKAIEAHTAFTQAMAQSHTAFLAAQQQAMQAMAQMQSGHVPTFTPQIAPTPVALPASVPPQQLAPQHPVSPSAYVQSPSAPQTQRGPEPRANTETSLVASATTQQSTVQEQIATPASPSVPASDAPSSVDLQQIMLEIVADKTGYPLEMLDLSMDLAGDLGVDSIKRVEILASMKERAEGLPEVDPAELGKLRTLQEIVDRMQAESPGGNVQGPSGHGPQRGPEPEPNAVGPDVAAAAPAASASGPSHSAADLQALMLEIVAEKTGYPHRDARPLHGPRRRPRRRLHQARRDPRRHEGARRGSARGRPRRARQASHASGDRRPHAGRITRRERSGALRPRPTKGA